jgi:uncharacterized SAM-binding protein YcdF (DUF218 family)
MAFFLSKILEYFIYPFTWVIILTLITLLVKKPSLKKRLFLITAIILFVFSEPIVLFPFGQWWDIKPATLKAQGAYSCAIVLGGFSSDMGNGKGYFTNAADRFIQAVELFQTGKVTHILVTGGSGVIFPNGFREADWVKTQLREFKVPDSCIIIEDKSRTTIENVTYLKPKLDSAHLQPPYVLITSSYHMRRSLQIFKSQKIDVIPYSCNFLNPDGYISASDFLPDPTTMENWQIYSKEVSGVIVNSLK